MENSSQQGAGPQNPLDTYPCIPLAEAQARVANWLNAITTIPYFEKCQDEIPRAIFISHEDLLALKDKYPDTAGIRVYFGLNQPVNNETPSADPYQVAGLVVPVFKDEVGKHHDMVVLDEEKTAVYDFTRPCPIFCDLGSELYVKPDASQR
jgi:hypothetical protein